MDTLNYSSVIESLRQQTEAAKLDALRNQQHWLEVALRADGGLIMLGEIENALRERGQAAEKPDGPRDADLSGQSG